MKNKAIQIKKIGTDRAEQISLFVNTLLKEDWNDIFKPQTIKSYQHIFSTTYFKKALRKECTGLGAFVNEDLIGIYILKIEFGGVGFIDWLGVGTRYRKQGVATDLLHQGEKLAYSLKLHYLYLYTERETNISFYEKRGFKHIGTISNAWYGETEHMLGKRLQSLPFAEVFTINSAE